MGRARRSAIGTWTFAGGGLVVEGGRRVGQDESAPLLARLPFPPSWRCVVAVPHARAGVSGAAETQAFAQLAPPPDGDVERVAYLVLMSLLPALVEADIESFGAALSEIQEMTGRWFAAAQGGTFAPAPARRWCEAWRSGARAGSGRARGALPSTASWTARNRPPAWPRACATRWDRAGTCTKGRSGRTARACGGRRSGDLRSPTARQSLAPMPPIF